MKNLITFRWAMALLFALNCLIVFAQTPQAISYQAVARNLQGQVLVNQAVKLRITILQGSAVGAAAYTETHALTTNQFGLLTLQIGKGTVVSGTFASIDWAANKYFTKIEMDETGGVNYKEIGTSEMLAVPYALHAKTVENEKQTLTLNENKLSISGGNEVTLPTQGGGNSLPMYSSEQIKALLNPTEGTLVYNTSIGKLAVYNGVCWSTIGIIDLEDELIFYYYPKSVIQGATVTDVDGNTYSSVVIGTQTWMSENLRTTKYNDGTAIPDVTDNATWAALTTPAYCWYNNDAATYKNKYGALYNGYTVETGKLCPTGWHVPTNAEWATLMNNLGGLYFSAEPLKSTIGWDDEVGNGTNLTGFNAIPSLYREEYDGTFYTPDAWGGADARFWGRDCEIQLDDVLYIYSSSSKNSGFSVRCVKD